MVFKSITRYQHLAIILFPLLLCGLLSVSFGKELCWDLAAYHYYNPYAILHNRWGQDYWPPTSIQPYLNPAMDFLHYFLIEFLPPIWTEFVLGAIHGLNLVIMIYLSYLFTSRYEKKHALTLAVVLALIGMYGPVSYSEIGSFMGDNLISIFVLGSILAYVIFLRQKKLLHLIFISGCLLGLGCGLKLTAMCYAIGFGLTSFLVRPKLKTAVIWLSGFTLGFFIANGFWMFFLAKHYSNPFFPFFNAIFHSPYFPIYNWTDTRFFPTSFLKKLFYPFYFSTSGKSTDGGFIDYRFEILYLLFFFTFIILSLSKLKKILDDDLKWLLVFFAFSYVAWQFCLSNTRYFVSLQILSALIIYLLLCCFIKSNPFRIVSLFVLTFFIMFTMTIMRHERVPVYGESFFNVKLPRNIALQPKGMVIMTAMNYSSIPGDLLISPIRSHINFDVTNSYDGDYAAPSIQNYLVPFFPATWHFVAITGVSHFYAINPKAKSMIQTFDGPLYLLSTEKNIHSLIKFAETLGLSSHVKGCQLISSDRMRFNYTSCDKIVICTAVNEKVRQLSKASRQHTT